LNCGFFRRSNFLTIRGLSLDGAQWVASRFNFLMHVNVLARLFRGKMLAMLVDARDAGQLKFFNTHAGLADKSTFKRFIAPLRYIKWVVYCKAPFAGPQQVLRYLSRYTHRVAISNRRLVAADDAGVAFRWKDYRINGPGRWKTMRLHPHEFIRRLLLFSFFFVRAALLHLRIVLAMELSPKTRKDACGSDDRLRRTLSFDEQSACIFLSTGHVS